jgi:hypothetical protein
MVGGILPWAFSPLLFHNEMSLLLIFLMGTNMIAGVLILPAYIAWRQPNFVTRYRTAAASEARMAGTRTRASPTRYGCRGYSRSMEPSRLRERPGWRSLRSAFASIWRIRSRRDGE